MPQWKLASATLPITLNVNADDHGPMSGTLTHGTTTYTVAGSWAASGSVPGRTASAFGVSGSSAAPAPAFVAATGIMTGPGTAPTRILLELAESSSADGSLSEIEAVLTPAP
jgi:hypothetical protein